MTDVVLGMAHRGRLNVLANVIGKSYEQIFREFEGELDPVEHAGLGRREVPPRRGRQAPVARAATRSRSRSPPTRATSRPSTRSSRAWRAPSATPRPTTPRRAVLPVLLHGDAAFAGQGVVAETFNLSEVPGYEVGGTVHVVVNNQLGFTTAPELGRSSVYATDVAKMVQAPIFHVNGDDPEAAVRVMRLAFEFRQQFQKDVVVDLVCYRRYGHNEADEPAFTQPRMYELIDAHPSVRELYTQQLVQRGDISRRGRAGGRRRLPVPGSTHAFAETHAGRVAARADDDAARPGVATPTSDRATTAGRDRRCRADVLERVVDGAHALARRLHREPEARAPAARTRAPMFERDEIDWALGRGARVRLAGARGHAGAARRPGHPARHVQPAPRRARRPGDRARVRAARAPRRRPGAVHALRHRALGVRRARLRVRLLGRRSDALVCWEAQFGDFANGAQIIIDQFVVAADDKWGQRSSLALLLPHGFEGQGPEHSSARIERFLTLCAEDNLRVVYPTTAAQYFHVLRRQAIADAHVPLVCFTPKRYLRMPQTRSPVADAHRRARSSSCSTTVADARPDAVQRVLAVHRQDRPRADGRARRAAARRSRSSGSSSSTRGPRPSSSPSLDRYPDATRCGGCRRSRRTWARGRSCTTGCTACSRDRAELRHIARAAEREPGERQRQGPRPRAARAPRRRLRQPLTRNLRQQTALYAVY